MTSTRPFFVALFAVMLSQPTFARTWTSAQGDYSLEGDAIAFSDATVVLKQPSGKLVAVDLVDLSQADRDYVGSKELDERLKDSIEEMQTWTSKDGVKIRGRVLAYGRKDYALARQRGKVTINGTKFEELDPLHQRLLLKVISDLEGQTMTGEHELTNWAKGLGGQPKVYPLEGVLMELETGDQIPVPFFLFGERELEVLKPGWDAWVKAHQADDSEARSRESLLMRSEAMHYHREEQQRQQIEILKLNMLAAATGLTSIWEVGLQPPLGVYGRRMTVMVTAQNSEIASAMALNRYPNYQVYGVRRASR